METSKNRERIRWAIVFLIGLIVSLILSDSEKESETPSNLSQTDSIPSIDKLKQPLEQIFHPSISPRKEKQIGHLFYCFF